VRYEATWEPEALAQAERFAYLDPTGLYKMGARYYDPTLARFTQTDPSGQETNPSAAFGNDPVNHTDPNGTWTAFDAVNTVLTGVALVAAIPTGGASLGLAGAIGLATAETAFIAAIGCGSSDDNGC
jgi:RHS repeat-associated protein